jgi:hypothetical protein
LDSYAIIRNKETVCKSLNGGSASNLSKLYINKITTGEKVTRSLINGATEELLLINNTARSSSS